MLIEIFCDKFRQERLHFKSGLNVVLGDEAATNSIGKSSLLMVIDFVFGGDTFLEHNKDVVEEMGDHEYCFHFKFDNVNNYFKRATFSPELVYECDADYLEVAPISIDQYRSVLKLKYGLSDLNLTFRSIVSLHSRVWGKDNLDVKRPLHVHRNKKTGSVSMTC